jgi:hypothetical protein
MTERKIQMIKVELKNITWENANDDSLPQELEYEIDATLEDGLESIMFQVVCLAYEEHNLIIDDADIEYEKLEEQLPLFEDEEVFYDSNDEEEESLEELVEGLKVP